MSKTIEPTVLVAIVVTLLTLLWVPCAFADHCPEELVNSIRPEHQLARIDALHDHFDRVVRLFGPPESKHEFQDESYPLGSGEAEYTWSLGDTTLDVLTVYRRNSRGKKIEAVQAVRVQGLGRSDRLITGRGIGLGDSRAQVNATYGTTYLKGSLMNAGPESTTVTFCFKDETALEFTFDGADRVNQIYLASAAE